MVAIWQSLRCSHGSVNPLKRHSWEKIFCIINFLRVFNCSSLSSLAAIRLSVLSKIRAIILWFLLLGYFNTTCFKSELCKWTIDFPCALLISSLFCWPLEIQSARKELSIMFILGLIILRSPPKTAPEIHTCDALAMSSAVSPEAGTITSLHSLKTEPGRTFTKVSFIVVIFTW